ncbi:galactose oxidase [Flavobacteriaceae bacterium TP-CH-4]|uniref:Galactose oxidase n=1 Tax=Pelagihabitans pacificus TaxID=2696054 RepID=A0A967AU00_9FLAO|nr:kelch repeat-containing protein [Pelagihabitans pacificus]NHF58978.1 galactose oxidase [Pelagihabitans pacificus]
MLKAVWSMVILLIIGSCKERPETTEEASQKEIIQPHWTPVVSEDQGQPVARHEAAFVRVRDKFYLLGGRDIRPVSIYDTKTKTWSQGVEPPLELHHFQPVVYDDKIHIIAAMTGGWPNETPTTHVYTYDPSTDSWSKGHKIPENRRRGAAGVVLNDGKVYVVCGIKNGHIGDHQKWLDRYDPTTGDWETLADAPRTRDHFQAAVTGGKLYAVAGRNTGSTDDPFGGTVAEVDVYDIEQNRWETLPHHLPTERAGNAAILFDGELVVAGGESPIQEKAHNEVEALNLSTHQWRRLPSLLEGRHGTGLLEFEGALYIASGCGNRGGEPELVTMEKYSN